MNCGHPARTGSRCLRDGAEDGPISMNGSSTGMQSASLMVESGMTSRNMRWYGRFHLCIYAYLYKSVKTSL